MYMVKILFRHFQFHIETENINLNYIQNVFFQRPNMKVTVTDKIYIKCNDDFQLPYSSKQILF